MPTSIRIVQLNIEGERHLDRIVPFLARQQPDVACIQELREQDIDILEKTLGAKCFFSPMMRFKSAVWGVGIFSKLSVGKNGAEYYAGNEDHLCEYDPSTSERKIQTQSYVLEWCDVIKEGIMFRVATTHFTWTPDGKPSDFQREHMSNLLKVLDGLGDFVLCGDFNAPRGGEIFTKLSDRFADNVPRQYVSSLDRELHKAGHLEYMVDGMFTTKRYDVSDVNMICGLSDHCALVGNVQLVRGLFN